jgi:hypothetical protein
LNDLLDFSHFIIKPIVGEANPSIVEPLVGLLQSLHIEVHYEAIELMKLLINYEVKDTLIKCLVNVLKPLKKLENLDNQNGNFYKIENKFHPKTTQQKTLNLTSFILEQDKESSAKLLVYVQQAAACKTIGILAVESSKIAELFLSVTMK